MHLYNLFTLLICNWLHFNLFLQSHKTLELKVVRNAFTPIPSSIDKKTETQVKELWLTSQLVTGRGGHTNAFCTSQTCLLLNTLQSITSLPTEMLSSRALPVSLHLVHLLQNSCTVLMKRISLLHKFWNSYGDMLTLLWPWGKVRNYVHTKT